MKLGSLARKLLGERFFPRAGRAYRSVFVDLRKVIATLPALPDGCHILDIGGGDGDVINLLLARFASARVTMIDLATNIGGSLSTTVADRVRVLPGLSLAAYAQQDAGPRPGAVIISDVIHHIPPAARPAFFGDLRNFVGDAPVKLIVKDVEPGHPLAWLGYMSDRLISGDPNVSLVSREEVSRLVRATFPKAAVRETALHQVNPPNYSLVFDLAG